jgi:zinc protease
MVHRCSAISHSPAWSVIVCIFLFTTPIGATPTAGAERIESITLANGMQIIVWPDQDIPNLTLYNFVRVGSRNEGPGTTGLAHFFEHMMFNGTSTRSPGDFDRTLEAQGARSNASTTADLTIYQEWFPKTALATVFEMEADRLRNLSFDPKIIESERGVVYSERRLRVDDNNIGRLQEQVQAAAFTAHPYGIPTIGWPSDIEGWTLQDLKTFFASYYAPNNCTLVLVGDIEPKQALALARQYFESIPSQPAPAVVRTREPSQQGERRIFIQGTAQNPLLQVAYRGIAGGDPRQPALELLMRILTNGDTSRLYRALVEQQQVAISTDGYADAGFDPGLVWFYLSCRPASIRHALRLLSIRKSNAS